MAWPQGPAPGLWCAACLGVARGWQDWVRGQASQPPCQVAVPSLGWPWPRPGRRGWCWALSRPRGQAVSRGLPPSLLPSQGHCPPQLQNGGGPWQPFCGALGRQRQPKPEGGVVGRGGASLRKLLWVAWPQGVGQAGPFWNLHPAQDPGHPGFPMAGHSLQEALGDPGVRAPAQELAHLTVEATQQGQ